MIEELDVSKAETMNEAVMSERINELIRAMNKILKESVDNE